ncbi:hypothetical protein GCM10023231_13950 [Olivibacter ginsenosidimutans]|uniref:FecR family protein n=1 Tax=Olivibacter ginsenosidimutans TaxID=1176537 RepID=A0ABP9AVZ8_9SPHI
MNRPSLRFSILLHRYLDKTATALELQELMDLLTTLPEEEVACILEPIYQETKESQLPAEHLRSEELLQNIFQQTTQHQQRKRTYIQRNKTWMLRMAAAAAIVGLTFSLNYIFNHYQSHTPTKELAQKSLPNDVAPGGNKATLTLANGQVIVLDTTKNGILAHHGGMEIKKIADGKLAFRIPANTKGQQAFTETNTISTPRGGQYQITLPDGSQVWLNAETTLIFPSQFDKQERKVVLNGEAYFEIAKHVKKPFKVISNHMEVHVLGTHFNLTDYEDERKPKTTLVDGSVRIKSGKQAQLLKPGEQAVLTADKQIKLVKNVDIETEIAWKNGLFQFKDAGIEQVMNNIARWYNIEVSYTGKINKKLLNGKISRDVNLSELMSMLAYTGVHYEIQGRKVIIKN